MDTPNASLAALKPADKAVGTILGLGALGAIGWGFLKLLPILVAAAANTILLIGEMVVIAFLLLVFGSPSTWQTIYYKWRNISRNLRKAIVREDPIGTLDTVIHRFARKLTDIDTNMQQSQAAARRQQNQIDKAEAESTRELSLAGAAKRMGKTEVYIALHATNADRWRKAADDMRPMAVTLAGVQTCLERARDLCASRLEDMQNQKAVLSVKLEALQDGQKAVRGFKRFFGNNPDLDMQDMAVEEIERQSTEAEAEIDQFMRVMNPMLDNADLKKSADAMQAMDKFNKYLDGGDKKALPPAAAHVPLVVKEAVVVDRQ